jgi:radical SAM superfamily enzyme YgiQ (UPF0313 family)
MKVLLIEPPFYLFQDIQSGSASFGLAMLAAMAYREGHDVRIFSPDFELVSNGKGETVITKYEKMDEKILLVKNRLEEIVNSFQPHVVGISFWTARAKVGLELAGYIKSMNSGIPVIAGGIHATILPDELLNSGKVDFVIRGEGEFSFVSLLESIEKGRDPKKRQIDCLSFLDEGGQAVHNPIIYCQNLDELPFPGYEHFINYKNFDKNAFQSVMSSRGCPFHCNYCASHLLWTRKIRYHSASFIFKMIKHIHRKFETDYFKFDDDTFTLNKRLVREICRLLKQEQMPIKWHCDTRVELVSYELLKEMKNAGLDTVAMGVESGDPEIRKMIRKISSLEATRNAFKVASESGIKTTGYFMIGIPGETYEQASRTLDLIEELQPTYPCISICIPYPGTDSFKQAMEMGTIKDFDSIDWSMYYHHSNINFSGKISDKQWESLLKRCTEIERYSAKRCEEERIKQTIKRITINKIISRYSKTPYFIFNDLYELISLFFPMFKRGRKKI